MTTRRLLVTVVALEVASGLPFGAVNDLVPLWLRVQGVDLASLGLLGLTGLPWTLKVLWGPWVDRTGTLSRWITGAMCVVIACMLAMAWGASFAGGAADLRWVGALLVLTAFASATQDVALDGWLVAATHAELRGRVTGLRVSGYRVAMALAGGGAAMVGARWGWPSAFAAVAALALAMLVALGRVPSPSSVGGGGHPLRNASPAGSSAPPAEGWWAVLADWARAPERLALFAFVVLYKVGDAAMAPMTRPFLLASGLDAGGVGLLTSVTGIALVSLGAVFGGEVVRRIGIRGALLWLGGAQAVSNLGYAVAASVGGRAPAVAACAAEGLATGLGSAALLSLLMTHSAGTERQTATRFAALSACGALTRTVAGALSGFGAERWGYAGWFAGTFVLALPALLLIPRITRASVLSEPAATSPA
jgi:PAT family beta-lactamase induction signal transducer AmpG